MTLDVRRLGSPRHRRAPGGERAPRTQRKLLRVALLAVAAASLTACHSAREPVDSIVLVTLDTLRADHLGLYGYPRPTSPFLDDLAADGTWFTNVVASSSHTAPSHASLMTALYPAQHGLLINGQSLEQEATTAAKLFRSRGFATAGFVSVRFLKGVRRGFATFDARTPELGVSRPAHRTIDAALGWIDQLGPDERFFLWVHLYDAHETDWRSHVSTEDLEAMRRESDRAGADFLDFLAQEHGVELPVGTATLDEYDRYDAQVAFMDRQLRRLHAAVASAVPEQRVLWAVTADHGEGMGSHGYSDHDKHLYREQLRVPLIIAGAGAAGAVRDLVRHVDVLPSLLELAAISDVEGLDLEGRSLAPLLRPSGSRPRTRMAFSQRRPTSPGHVEIGPPGQRMFAVQDERYKYIYDSVGDDALYDLDVDPLEATNLFGEGLPQESRLAGWLVDKLRAMESEAAAVGEPEAMDEETRRELRALGYVD